MPKAQEFLIGGEPETEEEQRIRLLELVWKHLRDRFGVLPPQDDATAEVPPDESEAAGSAQPVSEEFAFPAIPDLPEFSVGDVSPEKPEESPKRVATFNRLRPRTQEDINRDLERIGVMVQVIESEKDRVDAEIDAWLDRNQMTPRTALNYVEELVGALRAKQVAVTVPEARKRLYEKGVHRR